MSTSRDPVLRGAGAERVTAARFEVDFRHSTEVPIPAEVLERAKANAEATGYAQGWAQGQRDAKIAADAEAAKVHAAQQEFERTRAAILERALGTVARAAEQLEARTVPVAAELAEQVLRGAVELAEALLGRELAEHPERGLDALRRVMALVPETGPVTVRLCPADLADLGLSGPAEYEFGARTLTLRADPTLSPGDAIAEQGTTTVDARLTEAVRRVRSALAA